MSECAYCRAPVEFGRTRCNTETCYLARIATLEASLSTATARASELERECEAWRKLAEWAAVTDSIGHRKPRIVSFGNNSFAATEDFVAQVFAQSATQLAAKLGLIAPDGKGETT